MDRLQELAKDWNDADTKVEKAKLEYGKELARLNGVVIGEKVKILIPVATKRKVDGDLFATVKDIVVDEIRTKRNTSTIFITVLITPINTTCLSEISLMELPLYCVKPKGDFKPEEG